MDMGVMERGCCLVVGVFLYWILLRLIEMLIGIWIGSLTYWKGEA